MKKIFAAVLLLSLLLVLFVGCSKEKKLSEMKEDELLELLDDNGVEYYNEQIDYVGFVRAIIAEFEKDPDLATPALGSKYATNLYNGLRPVVKAYYENKQ